MTILYAVLAVIGILFFAGMKDIIQHKMFRRGWAIFIWRWFAGTHWTGEPLTNATWRRPGSKALTKTGHAPRFYFKPRWDRVASRWLRTFVPIGLVCGYFLAPTLTFSLAIVGTLLLLVRAAWKATGAYRKRMLHREWIDPLHVNLANLAGVNMGAKPSSWLNVAPDRTWAELDLPESFNDTEANRKRLAANAAERLGIEDPEVNWTMRGKESILRLSVRDIPRTNVGLPAIRSAMASLGSDELVLGLGKRSAPVDVSLHEDSPHVGASMGAGAGKSTLARLIAAQTLNKGAVVLILDVKRISHPWARGLPNVSYCDTPALIHDALIWLDAELERRNTLALYSSDYEGNVNANVGPRLIVIAEELNMTANVLRTYWKDTLNGRGVSPALAGIQNVAFAGRQVRMNLIMIGQMLTARVTGGQSGGNEARENIGVRIMARYTKKNWDMLVPEHPMPVASDVLGRVQVIASGAVRECQVAYLTGAEARKLSTSGIVSPLPAGMPGNPISSFTTQSELTQTADQDKDPTKVDADATNDITPETQVKSIPVTLSEAVSYGILKGNIGNARLARQRDPGFPKPVNAIRPGSTTAHYYDPAALAEYQAEKDRRKK